MNGVKTGMSHGSGNIKVSPVRIALVHLTKPQDVAIVGQIAAATGHVETDMIGQTVGFDRPKVIRKLKSWNIKEPGHILESKFRRYESLDDLKAANPDSRLIGTIVNGDANPFTYDWRENDIIVVGGANGMSSADIEKMDGTVTIPTAPEVSFLTANTVITALTYHILTERGLWKKDDA